MAALLAATRGNDWRFYGDLPEILIPDTFRWNDEEASLAYAAADAVDAMLSGAVMGAGPDVRAESFREATAELLGNPCAGSLEAFVHAMGGFGGYLVDDGMPRPDWFVFPRRERRGRAALSASRRWDERPISFDRDMEAIALELVTEAVRREARGLDLRQGAGPAP